MLELTTPVQYVKGIGPKLAEILATKGISTVDDLLSYLPFRYEDRLNPRGIAELRPGEMATVIGEVRNSGLFRTRRMPIFQLTVGQGGSRLRCLWFNATYLQDKFKAGELIALYGKVEQDPKSGELQIIQPQFEMLGDAAAEDADDKAAASLEVGRIVPIYESAGQGRVTARWFRRVIRKALDDLTPDLAETIPAAVRGRLALLSSREALWRVHWPEAGESFEDLQSSRTPAHIRLIFEELFFLELGLELKRRQQKTETGFAFRLDDRVRQAIKKILPFPPDDGADAGSERDCRRHAKALSHAAFAAGGCRYGKNHHHSFRSRGHRQSKQIPGCAHGAHRNSGAAAALFRAPNSGERLRLSHRPADRLVPGRPQARTPPSHRAGKRAAASSVRMLCWRRKLSLPTRPGHRRRATPLRGFAAPQDDEEIGRRQ